MAKVKTAESILTQLIAELKKKYDPDMVDDMFEDWESTLREDWDMSVEEYIYERKHED